MPEFVLKSEGVAGDPPVTFASLPEFVQGYIEALFFTECEPGTTRNDAITSRGTIRKSWADGVAEGRHHELHGEAGFSDLTPEALESIIRDCLWFENDNRDDLTEALDQGRVDGYGEREAGRDFWYTRNGHGVGYWDREELKGGIGDKLSEAAKARGEVDVFLTDKGGKVCFL